MTAYYNEWDKQAAAWLRELIKQGHIADGVVDERDIKEVEPADLREFTQCHFFAGIGGWSVALRLAGWADDRPVWTGSPPCQPFSVAGRGKGIEDDRHIAPVWLDLVKKCRPSILFGEQVAAATTKDGWLDSLQDALENEGYATGATVLPACSVNAPHIRQRLWFTARLEDTSSIGRCGRSQGHYEAEGNRPNAQAEATGSSTAGGLGDTASIRQHRGSKNQTRKQSKVSGSGYAPSRLADTKSGRKRSGIQETRGSDGDTGQHRAGGSFGGLADTNNIGQSGQGEVGRSSNSKTQGNGQINRAFNDGGRCGLADTNDSRSTAIQRQSNPRPLDGPDNQRSRTGFEHGKPNCPAYASESQWGNPDWLWCRDGKWRSVEPSTFPLAHGIPARVGRLRGYGNAIVPQVAAEVIQVMMGYEIGEPTEGS